VTITLERRERGREREGVHGPRVSNFRLTTDEKTLLRLL
jgi:hypothetical protein